MEYDDNDFQSHNFLPVREDNNKFPPNLISFGLPRLDLDGHLQVHLRFDSLVDTDALLGMHGQESNWIENFSAGSAIEFSSSAAESCPIPRHKNVWSEATSSESVEMLLKSVGEDEMLDKRATIKEADDQQGLGGVNDEIDPCLVRDDSLNTVRGDNVMTTPALPPDKYRSAFEVHLPCGAQKEKFQVINGDAEVSYACSEDHTDISGLCNEKKSSFLERKEDPQREGCKNSAFCEKPDGLLEAIPCQIKVIGEVSGLDENTEQIKKMTSIVVESDGKFEGTFMEIGNDISRLSHLTSGYKDDGHGQVENLPEDGSQISATLLSENTTMVIDYGQGSGPSRTVEAIGDYTLIEEILEKQEPSENANNHVDSTSGSAAKLHSSVHATPETPSAKVKDDDCVGYILSNFTSQSHASAYLNKCPEDEVGEKSDATLIASEVITRESSPILQTDEGSKGPGSGIKASELCGENSLVGKPCDVSVIPLGDSIVENRNARPATSDTTHANIDAVILIEKKADSPSPEQKDVISPSFVPDSAHFDDKEAMVSGVSCLYISKSVADGQNSSEAVSMCSVVNVDDSSLKNAIQNETFTTLAESSELTSRKESATISISHPENATISNMVVEQEEPTSPLPVPDITRTTEERVITPEITCPVIYDSKSPQPFTLSKSNAINPLLDVGSSIQSSLQPNVSLPTIVSCNELPQGEAEFREDNGKSTDKARPVLNKIRPDADKVESPIHDIKGSGATVIDKSFTFEVGSLAELSKRDNNSRWKPFTNIQSVDAAQVPREESQEGHAECEDGKHEGTINKKTKEERIVASGCSTGKVNAAKKKPAKEALVQKPISGSDGILCSQSPISVGTISRDIQQEQMRQYACGSSSGACCFPAAQTPSFPDLNTSIVAASLFHRPFTDLQQVQLRAQIFVYGSLIQGTPPKEACMVSAFGDTDSGRNLWVAVWHAAVERFHNQKSPLINCETPNLRSGNLTPEKVIRCSSLESKTLTPIASRSGTKVTSASSSSTLPLPSPLWSISGRDSSQSNNLPRAMHLDFSQVLSPAYFYQSSQVRPYLGNGLPRLPQTIHPGSLIMPAQRSINPTANYSTVPTTDTIRATPVRDSSVSCSPSMQIVSPGVLLPASGPPSISSASIGQIEAQKKAASTANTKNVSTASKSTKKKVAVPEVPGPFFPVSQAQADPASVAGVATHLPVSTGMGLSVNYPVTLLSGSLSSATSASISPSHYQIIGNCGVELKAALSEETCCRIEQAKLQAEDAVAFAASAVRHSQDIWTHLTAQKNSGFVSEIEEKLASAAVAAAAAASVAKAAAAAAKIASDAALQAQMMADEALNSARREDSIKISDKANNIAKSSAVSTSKGEGKILGSNLIKGKILGSNLIEGKILGSNLIEDKILGSNLILSAAREASKRRLEAASAATKRAENMDDIVKAAELAADAVSQAGAIVAMGEPLPFSLTELVEHGPEGYWRFYQSVAEKHSKAGSQDKKQLELEGNRDLDISGKKFKELLSCNKAFQKTGYKDANNEPCVHPEENYAGNNSGDVSSTVRNVEHEKNHLASNVVGNIQKGSVVEVVSDEDGLRGVWFSACVLDVNDGKAYVCYNDLLGDGGSGQLKEWIPLDTEGNGAPRIRIAHPDTVAKSGRTRKRRRDVVPNYTWAVGDHVDAWIRDGWWEGIITEKNEDETKLTVHYPAGGDSSTVRTWDLRPSLIWKDGQWTKWTRLRENSIRESDTPLGKRQRIARPDTIIESGVDGGIGKLSKSLHNEGSRKPEGSRPLPLSEKEKTFSVGKHGREESDINLLKVKRIGLQKEGSKVVFGIPKPGKKRKFMDVSKHFVGDKTEKISEETDSVKFEKYLMQQSSRIYKHPSKVDKKGKGFSGPKARRHKLVKSHNDGNTQKRSIADKDNPSVTTLSVLSGGESGFGPFPSTRPFSNEGSIIGKNGLETGSSPNSLTSDNPVVEPSMYHLPAASSSKKSSSALESKRGVKGKHTPSFEKSTASEEKGSENSEGAITDATEPRRSKRKIQPTSRLLEGLQSSLLISKIPSFPHDRGAKALHRGGSSSRKTRG